MKRNRKKFYVVFLLAILFSLDIRGQVTVGSDVPPATGALLDLKTMSPNADNVTSDRGGLLLPRVQLQRLNSLLPFCPDVDLAVEGARHTGLTVYNITPVPAENIATGLYYWDGNEWKRLVDDIPQVVVTMYNLFTANPIALTSFGDPNTPGQVMPFGEIYEGVRAIRIPEGGSYAFCVRYYSVWNTTNVPDYTNVSYPTMYFHLIDANNRIYDSAEFAPAMGGKGDSRAAVAAFTVVLTGTFRKGDMVRITNKWAEQDYIYRYNLQLRGVADNNMVDKANRTSLVWWRL